MAVSNEDLARLVVSLEATTTKYYNALKKAQQQTNSSASAIEKRLTSMSSAIDRTFAALGRNISSSLTGPLAGVGAAFSVREVMRYADAWTTAGNAIAASSDITGLQGRNREGIRRLADESRAGFEETVTLYTRIQRAASDVANSEEEVARATSVVNKAFKAGGAATSELNAGIIQLSQGLASGLLQGDELRSVRENAPVLAKVIADYFGVTVAGLKELGAEGKLTSDKVFKAILAGEAQIESAFGTTQATIADGFTKVRNALIEYVGSADQSLGATVALNVGLNALADNFSSFADVLLKVAALIAGALVGRSLVAMTGSVLNAARAVGTLTLAMQSASKGGASFATVLRAAGLAAGPIATVLGGVALLAIQHFAAESAAASARINGTTQELRDLGFVTTKTTQEIREQTDATKDLREEEKKLNDARKNREVISDAQDINTLRYGNFGDNFLEDFGIGSGNKGINNLRNIIERASKTINYSGLPGLSIPEVDRTALEGITEFAKKLQEGVISAREVQEELRKIQLTKINQDTQDLVDAFSQIALNIETTEQSLALNETSSKLQELEGQLISFINTRATFANMRYDNEDSVKELEEFSKKIQENDLNAEELIAELTRLQNSNPDLSAHNSAVQGFIDKIKEAIAEVQNLSIVSRSNLTISDSSADLANMPRGSRGEILRERQERRDAAAEYIKEQEDINSLSLEEREIKEEIARIVKEAGKKGIKNTRDFGEGELERLAKANLALKDSDRESKKSGNQSERDLQKFRDELIEQERSNKLLQDEYALREGLNPLIEDYGYALEKWKKEQELLNAAKQAGITIDAELETRIGTIAEAYANGTVALEKLQETQDKARESMREWLDLAKSSTRSFIDDLIEGKSAAEALGNVLNQLGSYLIDLGLNSIFGTGSGGNPLGLFGSLFNLPGRASGGPVTKGQPYVVGERRPELFVPNQSGVIIPKLPNGMGSGSNVTAPIQISIDATGADKDGLMRVQQELVTLRAQVPYLVRQQVSRRTQKGW